MYTKRTSGGLQLAARWRSSGWRLCLAVQATSLSIGHATLQHSTAQVFKGFHTTLFYHTGLWSSTGPCRSSWNSRAAPSMEKAQILWLPPPLAIQRFNRTESTVEPKVISEYKITFAYFERYLQTGIPPYFKALHKAGFIDADPWFITTASCRR